MHGNQTLSAQTETRHKQVPNIKKASVVREHHPQQTGAPVPYRQHETTDSNCKSHPEIYWILYRGRLQSATSDTTRVPKGAGIYRRQLAFVHAN